MLDPSKMSDALSSSIVIGQSVLKFLHSLSPSKAHWYNIIPPCVEKHNSCFICSVFPSLSDLLNLDESILEGAVGAFRLSILLGCYQLLPIDSIMGDVYCAS
jgi:hypothetical protein